MGTLSTADLGGAAGNRARCCCGDYYDRAGDGDHAWTWPDGLVLPAGYCKPCARLRYSHDHPRVAPAAGASRPARPVPVSQDPPNPQTRSMRVRRRSDIQPKGARP